MSIETYDAPTLEGSFQDDGAGGVTLKGRYRQAVKFYRKRVMDFRAKKDENGNISIDKRTGLPFKETCEKEVLMVKVTTPGDKNEKDEVATDLDKRQHYPQYKAFMEGKFPEGHPLEEADFIQPGTLLELKRYGIHVIEQLARCTDLVCDQRPEVWELREVAKEWLRINSPEGYQAQLLEVREENRRLQGEVEQLKSKVLNADGNPYLMPMPVDTGAARDAIVTKSLSPEEFNESPKKKGR